MPRGRSKGMTADIIYCIKHMNNGGRKGSEKVSMWSKILIENQGQKSLLLTHKMPKILQKKCSLPSSADWPDFSRNPWTSLSKPAGVPCKLLEKNAIVSLANKRRQAQNFSSTKNLFTHSLWMHGQACVSLLQLPWSKRVLHFRLSTSCQAVNKTILEEIHSRTQFVFLLRKQPYKRNSAWPYLGRVWFSRPQTWRTCVF